MLIVLTSISSADEAEALAEAIVNARLAACVQILPRMTSVYFWEGEVRREQEHLLLIKTLAEKYDTLETFIRKNHPYDVPEIIAISAEKVSEAYLSWMKDYFI